jgi:hypothetical protein
VAGVQITVQLQIPKLQTTQQNSETNRIPVRHVKIEGGSAKARSRSNGRCGQSIEVDWTPNP